MIRANELRLGNLVLFNGRVDSIIEVGQILNGFCSYGGYFNLDMLKPIPLTPEWLERMGFTNGTFLHSEKYYGRGPVRLAEINGKFYYGTHGLTGFNIESREINYLHQLQNLYYALTNTELKVNLNKMNA